MRLARRTHQPAVGRATQSFNGVYSLARAQATRPSGVRSDGSEKPRATTSASAAIPVLGGGT